MRAAVGVRTLFVALCVATLGVTPVFGAASALSTCTGALTQDDAGSGRDAGDDLAAAVTITDDAVHYAAIGVASPSGTDLADWFSFEVPPSSSPRTVMADLQLEDYAAAPYGAAPLLTIEARGADGSLVATSTVASADGHRIVLTTEQGGLMYFGFMLDADPASPGCPVDDTTVDPTTVTAADTYAFYLGCDPHCYSTA